MKTDIRLIGIVLSAHSLEVMTISQCEQCSGKISKNLASSIVSQMQKLDEFGMPRLICVACFCANGNSFITPEHMYTPPLTIEAEVVEEERELERKKSRIDRKKQAIRTRGSDSVPNFSTLKRTIRWELSKSGRIGKPVGGKNLEGANTYLCPICGVAVERLFNFPGRSLDDVVQHLELSGCYDMFLIEESA